METRPPRPGPTTSTSKYLLCLVRKNTSTMYFDITLSYNTL